MKEYIEVVCVNRLDVENGRDRTAKVAPDAKLLDSAGKELTGGLKSDQLKEGVKAVLTVVPRR